MYKHLENLMVCLLFTAVYNWNGETRYGLPLEIGDTVQILEECLGKEKVYIRNI